MGDEDCQDHTLTPGPLLTGESSKACLSAAPQVCSDPQQELSSGPFLPLLTLNSEYGLVEFWNFPLNHWPEVLFQLVIVLLEFLLILPLIGCDETLVFLHSLPATEMKISGWEEKGEVLLHKSLEMIIVLNTS